VCTWLNLSNYLSSSFTVEQDPSQISVLFLLQLGRTKVFLRAGQIGILDSRRAEILDNAATHVQRRFRTFIAHRDFISTRAAASALQAYCRGSVYLL
jgi:myosin heavy subunit